MVHCGGNTCQPAPHSSAPAQVQITGGSLWAAINSCRTAQCRTQILRGLQVAREPSNASWAGLAEHKGNRAREAAGREAGRGTCHTVRSSATATARLPRI